MMTACSFVLSIGTDSVPASDSARDSANAPKGAQKHGRDIVLLTWTQIASTWLGKSGTPSTMSSSLLGGATTLLDARRCQSELL